MTSWLISIFLFLFGFIIATLLFIPEWGLFSFLGRAWRKTDRVLIEDTLKHIQLCDFENRKETFNFFHSVDIIDTIYRIE